MLNKEYILECLDKYCVFDDLSQDTFENVIRDLKAAQCFNNWTYDNGVTKGVLMFAGADFVIKIPFMGEADYDCEHWEDSDGNRYEYNTRHCNYTHTPSNWNFYEERDCCDEFCGAHYSDCGWDYCASEAHISKAALLQGLAGCLAKTELLGYANGHPIYIQEKCKIYCDEESTRHEQIYKYRKDNSYEELAKIREDFDFYSTDNDWLLDFVNYWGKEVLQKFAEFLFDFDINDLHNGNIGYRNGVPVLVDYSGYWH